MCAADYQLELRNNMVQATDTNNTQYNDDLDAMWNDAKAIIMESSRTKKLANGKEMKPGPVGRKLQANRIAKKCSKERNRKGS